MRIQHSLTPLQLILFRISRNSLVYKILSNLNPDKIYKIGTQDHANVGHFKVVSKNKQRYFAKIILKKNSNRELNAFALSEKMYSDNIPVPKPILEFDSKNTFQVFVYEWIDGKPYQPHSTHFNLAAKSMIKIDKWIHGHNKFVDSIIGDMLDIPFWEKQSYRNNSHFDKARDFFSKHEATFAHNDIHLGNLIFTENACFIVDFEEMFSERSHPLIDKICLVERTLLAVDHDFTKTKNYIKSICVSYEEDTSDFTQLVISLALERSKNRISFLKKKKPNFWRIEIQKFETLTNLWKNFESSL